MKWIKEYFIKKALVKAKQAKKAQPLAERIDRVGIVASSLVELNETKEVITPLLQAHTEIIGLFYGEGIEVKEAFSYEDFTLSGKPKNNITDFMEDKVDLIIASAENLNVFSLYLLYLNPQSYSVGFYHESHAPYMDLMLAKEDLDQKGNMEHLLKYLKQVI